MPIFKKGGQMKYKPSKFMLESSRYDENKADYAVTFIAVSYTHLDVYKRQKCHRMSLSKCSIVRIAKE